MKDAKPSTTEKIAYTAGDFTFGIYWQMFSMFLLYFYTDVFGVAAGTIATMLLVTRLWDTVNDPVMGVIADRTVTRWGKFRPYLIWFSIPMAVVGVLTFSSPDLSPTGKVVYAYAIYCLMMMSYTAVNVPYASLLGVMTDDPDQKTSFATYRMVGALTGSMAVQLTALSLVKYFGDGDEKRGFQYAMAIFAALGVVLLGCCFAGVKERVRPMSSRSGVADDLGDLARNMPWIVLCVVSCLLFISISVRGASILYYFKYYVDESGLEAARAAGGSLTTALIDGVYHFFGDVGLSALYMTGGSLATIIGMIVLRPVADRIGKRNALVGMLLGYSAVSALMFHVEPDQIALIYTLYFAASLLFGPMMPLLWSMYADTADYSEWKTGRRSTGLLFSASSSSQKLGWALAASIAGWSLEYVNFVANQEQTQETLDGIRLLMSYVPAGLGVAAAGLTLLYSINTAKLLLITDDLRARRVNTAGGAASGQTPIEPA